jgi:hypothetical protein
MMYGWLQSSSEGTARYVTPDLDLIAVDKENTEISRRA